ncbi:1-phosphofructokinase family hexose kinase [Niveibacterium sp. SC-1]|uniref:1-phosphofructokinase family hexose kinase n=1 Tax=Niveibacterium sp. SC-1 TaxID=3135646 RepID=UPI003120435E
MSPSHPQAPEIVCIALNPAIDQTVELEQFTPGQLHRARAVKQEAGGKAINVAACLADAGIPVAVAGRLGRENAEDFRQLFDAKGIHDRLCYVAGHTRINTKLVDLSSGTTTEINLPGSLSDPEGIPVTAARILRRAIAGDLTRWAIASGSVPPGWAEDIYATGIHHLKRRGVMTVLDASGAALRAGLDAQPTIAKPNREELAELVGRPLGSVAEVVEAARALVAAGKVERLLCVSLGHEGALFLDQARCIHALPLPLSVRSTVGAGDAMVAGIVAAQLQKLDLDDCARVASAWSAAHLVHQGPGLGAIETLEALIASVHLAEL